MSYSYGFGFLCPRLAASYILRTCILVFNSLLWIKPEGWRDLPCITALTYCRRLHRSIKFREILLRFTLQRQPKCYSRNDKKTYRYVCFFSLCEKPMPHTHNVSMMWFTTSNDCVQKSLPCLCQSKCTASLLLINPGDPSIYKLYDFSLFGVFDTGRSFNK